MPESASYPIRTEEQMSGRCGRTTRENPTSPPRNPPPRPTPRRPVFRPSPDTTGGEGDRSPATLLRPATPPRPWHRPLNIQQDQPPVTGPRAEADPMVPRSVDLPDGPRDWRRAQRRRGPHRSRIAPRPVQRAIPLQACADCSRPRPGGPRRRPPRRVDFNGQDHRRRQFLLAVLVLGAATPATCRSPAASGIDASRPTNRRRRSKVTNRRAVMPRLPIPQFSTTRSTRTTS